MRDFLIALAILLVAGAYLVHRARKNGTKEERRRERRRLRSEAAAAESRHEILDVEEQEHVEAIHALVEEHRTDEYKAVTPARQFEADALAAPIPDLHPMADPALFAEVSADWFFSSVPFEPASMPFPELPADPDPYEELSFTKEWTTADIAQLVAEAKAEASR